MTYFDWLLAGFVGLAVLLAIAEACGYGIDFAMEVEG